MNIKNRSLVKGLVFVVAATFLFSGISMGQVSARVPTELALFEEIPIVYTPAKKEQLITEAPASTYILTAEDIKLYGGINIYDAIRQVSGVTVMATTVSQPSINIRGMVEAAANSTLLLVDGRNVYLPGQGLFLWETIPIQLDEIKQIEIVKGPVASLYGANAFSGLINIITKSPEEINGTIISGRLGTENTYIGSLVHGQKINNFGYKVSLGWKRFDFFENDDYKTDIGKLNAELEFDLSDISKLSISAGGSRGNFPFFLTPGSDSFGKFEGPHSYTKLDYELGGFSVLAFWNYSKVDYDIPRHYFKPKFNDYEIELKYNFDLWEQHSITVGGGGRYDSAEMTIFLEDDEKTQTLWNIYFQDDFEVTEALRLVGSGRLDHHSLLNYNFSGRLAAIYNLTEDHLIRASIGNSFRAPTITELYTNSLVEGDPLGLGVDDYLYMVENKDLNEETIITGEVSYQGWFFEKKLKANIDLFWSKLEDMIDLTEPQLVVAHARYEAHFANTGKVYTWGIEPGVEITFTDWLKGIANYSYQDVDLKGGAYRNLTPKHKVNLSLIATIMERLTASVNGHYVSKVKYGAALKKVNGYFLLNARLGYQFNDYVELAIAGSNILNNSKHYEMGNAEKIGTRIIGGMTIKF